MPEKTKTQKDEAAATLRLPAALRDKFKIYCIKNNIEMREATEKILQWAMKRKFKSFTN